MQTNTIRGVRPALSASDARHLTYALLAGVAVAVALAALLQLSGITPDVLKAASGNALIKPGNGGVIEDALKTINGNALWLMITGVGTAVTVVGVALAFGVRDASNWAFRIAGAIVLVFVVGPGLVA